MIGSEHWSPKTTNQWYALLETSDRQAGNNAQAISLFETDLTTRIRRPRLAGICGRPWCCRLVVTQSQF